MFFRNLTGIQGKSQLKRSATTHTLGRRSSSKPIIFILPQPNGEPILYKVDAEKMHLIRDMAESIKMPEDTQSSSQSLPISSASSLASGMEMETGKDLINFYY